MLMTTGAIGNNARMLSWIVMDMTDSCSVALFAGEDINE